MFNPCRDHCMIYAQKSYTEDCNTNCEYAKAIKEISSRDYSVYSMLKTIKSKDEPPFDSTDPYYLREPWNKLGAVSSGICMRWYWFRNDVIIENASINDIIRAYNEITTCNDSRETKTKP